MIDQLNIRRKTNTLNFKSIILNLILGTLLFSNFSKAQAETLPMIDSPVQQTPAPIQVHNSQVPAPAPDNLYTAAKKYLKYKKDQAIQTVKTRTRELTTAHKRHKNLPSGRVINILRPDQFYYYLEHAERKMLVVAQFIRSNCQTCPRLSPPLNVIANDNIDVIFLHIDTARSMELTELASKFNVSRYPTFLYFKPGRNIPVFRLFGTDVATLTAEINRLH